MKKFVALSTIHLKIFLKKLLKHNKFQVGAIDESLKFKFPLVSIINIDTSDLPGSHWIALFANTDKNILEVFDSFGNNNIFYDRYLKTLTSLKGYRLVINSDQIQSERTVLCGYFCLYFLYYRSRGISFQHIMERFEKHNLKTNEILIRNFFKRFKFPNLSSIKIVQQSYCSKTDNEFSSFCIQKNNKYIRV